MIGGVTNYLNEYTVLTSYTIPCRTCPMQRSKKTDWDAKRIRALRKHLGNTQQELADELGTRQQTISEWETEMYKPKGTSATLLGIVAEKAGFNYETE